MDHFKSVNVDPTEEEARIRREHPNLLHENERIELAFRNKGGKGRDKQFFLTDRVLIEDGKGMGSKRKNYKSVAYTDVVLYAVQTAGGGLDNDTELYMWTSAQRHKLEFSAKKVDVFEIYQFMNRKVAQTKMKLRQLQGQQHYDFIDPVPPNMDKKESTVGKLMDWMGDNAKQINNLEAETHFKTKFPILLRDERVEIVFQSGRDFTIFTNVRMLRVDVKGISGKRVEFLTIPYGSIDAFAVQTAGKYLDRDTELKLHLSKLGDYSYIKQDFAKKKANLWAIQKVLCNHVLGHDKAPLSDIMDDYELGCSSGGIFSLIDLISDNNRPIDRFQIENALKLDPPILQGSETVELAFQGRRDITLFTTKRVVLIDKKGFFGKKMQYTSLAWEKFVAFGVRTAGAVIDFDTEVQLYTELHFYPGQAGTDDQPPIPARPEESCLELDFSTRCVDIFKLKYYLSRRIIEISRLERGAPVPTDFLTGNAPDSGAVRRLFEWLGNDQRELNPSELNHEFHTSTKILLDDENILMAFKAGRDVSLFTNLRVMVIDVQGLAGCKILYTSLPYRSIRSFSVCTAGQWDRDSEIVLYTRNRWHIAKLELEFSSGRTDVMQIQKLLSAFIIGKPSDNKVRFGPKNYGANSKNRPGFGSLKASILGRSTETNADAVNVKFHNEVPLLLEEETVVRAFEEGRDMYVYTDRRLILVDTKGLSGKSVKYKSLPYRSIVGGFEFETAGSMLDKDAEIYTYTNISKIHSRDKPRSVSLLHTKQSIAVKKTDIYEIAKLVLDHTVFDNTAVAPVQYYDDGIPVVVINDDDY